MRFGVDNPIIFPVARSAWPRFGAVEFGAVFYGNKFYLVGSGKAHCGKQGRSESWFVVAGPGVALRGKLR